MFVHLAVHYPKPEHADDLLASMKRARRRGPGTPGLVQMNAWRDAKSDRLVGLAIWESREAWEAGGAADLRDRGRRPADRVVDPAAGLVPPQPRVAV